MCFYFFKLFYQPKQILKKCTLYTGDDVSKVPYECPNNNSSEMKLIQEQLRVELSVDARVKKVFTFVNALMVIFVNFLILKSSTIFLYFCFCWFHVKDFTLQAYKLIPKLKVKRSCSKAIFFFPPPKFKKQSEKISSGCAFVVISVHR